MQALIAAIKAVDGVKSVNLHEATGRYYINLAGNGSYPRGERNSKLYLTPAGKLIWECGKGTTTRAYDEQRHAVEAVMEAR